MDPVARDRRRALLLAVPALTIFAAFWLLPMARLVQVGAGGPQGIAAYGAVVTNPRYFSSLVSTVALSLGVTAVTLLLSLVTGLFLQRNRFRANMSARKRIGFIAFDLQNFAVFVRDFDSANCFA